MNNKSLDGFLAGNGYFYKSGKKPPEQTTDEIVLTETSREKPVSASLADFHDAHHLRLCDESMLSRRILPLESAINMRDIGGYTNAKGQQIKWGKIFRGEELCHLNQEDQERFDNDYGIKYIIDFRQSDKAQEKPDRVPEDAQYLNISILSGVTSLNLDYNDPYVVDKFMSYIYDAQVRTRADRLVPVLKILRDDPDAVLYIHCTNGKDRTGFMIAVIMLLAGIPEETIISDYSLTNLTFEKALELLGGTMANEVGLGEDTSRIRGFFGVDPDWIQIQLDYIRENYGTVDNYLIANTELNQEDLDKIRENILE